MSYTGNVMVDDDNGWHPSSPFHNETLDCFCDHCQRKVAETNEVCYMLESDLEDVEPRTMQVCEPCEVLIKKSKKYILI